jgi:flagellar biosynthesis protein FlhF
MRIKSFYASSVEGAVASARRELGPEAMLVQSRKAPLEARHLGEYEVVCAVVPETPPAGSDSQTSAGPSSHNIRLAQELAELRKQLDVMGRTITRSAWSGPRWSSGHPALADAHARLMAADLDSELVNQVLEAIYQGSADPGNSCESLEPAVLAELGKRILVHAALGPSASVGPRIAALVGPPGAGKTTTIAKLAVQYGMSARRPLDLLSMDDYRVAGADQLRSYATILGAGFQALDTVGALAQALEERRGKGLILIDTPGYGPRDMDRAADLARFLSSRPDISTHLILTASMKSADLTHVADRFEIFRPSSLLFTRLDETDAFGTAFSLAVRRGKPISFLGTGQEIPDDLLPASRERILGLLWPEAVPAVRSAA